jgi:hypothetical protein
MVTHLDGCGLLARTDDADCRKASRRGVARVSGRSDEVVSWRMIRRPWERWRVLGCLVLNALGQACGGKTVTTRQGPTVIGASSSTTTVSGGTAGEDGGRAAGAGGSHASVARGGSPASAGGYGATLGGDASAAGGASGTSACGYAACSISSCDAVVDACGNTVDCGSCPSGSICGLLTANVCTPCKPATCADRGAQCGSVSDGCAGIIDCGYCSSGPCGAVTPNRCDSAPPPACTNFCLDQAVDCAAESPTTVTGTVFAPNGELPVPKASVYVPNGSTTEPWGLSVFTDGVANGALACDIQGPPLVLGTTYADGRFVLRDVPAGTEFPLVVQLGHWRRVIRVPKLTACTTTALDPSLTRLPRRQGETHPLDAIPLMALSTGQEDALECVLRKLGVDDFEFSNAGGKGRIQFYRDNGARCTDGGGSCTGDTPDYLQLTAAHATLDQYDAVLFPCNGGPHDIAATHKTRVLDSAQNRTAYVNKGGRALFTHFSYAWLYNQPPSMALPWQSTTSSALVDTPWSTVTGLVDTTLPPGRLFATWLALPSVNALSDSSPPRVTLEQAAKDLNDVASRPVFAAWWWIRGDTSAPTNPSPADAIFQLSFNAPAASWFVPWGRVVFSSFHVTANPDTSQQYFPAECNATFSTQEKMLAYMIFNLTECLDDCDDATWGCDVPLNCEQACSLLGGDPTVPYPCRSTPHAGYTVPCTYPDGLARVLQCYCLG